MVPTYLTLRNFLSYGEDVPTLDFGRFHVACLTGNNGHGKSALLDAITYALWGEARKRSGDRKPDEGLLRLGASEMRVEFGFSLDDNLFRVIRSFRKNRATQLDLQALDSAAETYRPFSDGASLTQTQLRINQLLSMDYETFINSAFILQGRSNEFTQRSSRQRKDVLADILNLSRYEQLRERAHKRLQETTQRTNHQEKELEVLREGLADAEEHRGALTATTDLLTCKTHSIQSQECAVAELSERLHERRQLQEQSRLHQEKKNTGQRRLGAIAAERTSVTKEMSADEETLRSESRLELYYAEFQTLSQRDADMEGLLVFVRELKVAQQESESAITAARHEVEKEREKWHAELESLHRQREQVRSLLDREQIVAENVRLLGKARAEAQTLEELRHEKLELTRKVESCDLQIQMEGKRLEGECESLRSRIEGLESRRAALSDSVARACELLSQVGSLEVKVGELDEVKSKGTQLNSDIESCHRRTAELEGARVAQRERMAMLHGADGPSCPLCGSELDGEHHQHIASELARQEEQIGLTIDRSQRESRDLENEREQLRACFKELSGEVESLVEVRRMLAQELARELQLRELDSDCRGLAERLSAVESQIAGDQFAMDHRRRKQNLRTALEGLAYDQAAHTGVECQIERLAAAEGEMVLLGEAKTRHERVLAESLQAEVKLGQFNEVLEQGSFAPDRQVELDSIKCKLTSIDYAPEEHAVIRARLKTLGDVPDRRERLLLARQRQSSGRELLARYDRELSDLTHETEQATAELDAVNRRLETLGDLDAEHRQRSEALSGGRQERDELLQRQGSLQARIDRCEQWQSEATSIGTELASLRERSWLLAELAEAFGKDGIQALIIESAIPEIEEEANSILARLTDNRIQISIESLRDLKKGGTRETLDIKIADEVGERSYDLYSGGEAFRTDFALRIALAKTLARRAGTRLRTLIIDEGFGTQDSEGIDYLIDAINEISRDFDKLIVVTHLPELKNAFPVQIQVTKHPDIGSRFEIIENN